MAPRRYPTWASGGAMGIYIQPVPVFIAGGWLSTSSGNVFHGVDLSTKSITTILAKLH